MTPAAQTEKHIRRIDWTVCPTAIVERSRLTRTGLGLLLGVAIIAALLYFVNLGDVLAALGSADLLLVALAAGFILLWNVSWGVSLWYVLNTQDAVVPLRKTVLFHAAAAFANHVTPFGQAGGEPVTAWLISESTDTDYEVSLASVASFDALHFIPSLIFVAVGATYLLSVATVAGEGITRLAVALVVVVVLVPAVGLLVWRTRYRIARRIETVVNRVVRGVARVVPGVSTPSVASVTESLRNFSAAVERVASDRRRLVFAVSFSMLGSVFQACSLLVLFYALSAPIPVYVPLVVKPIAAMGGAIPTPGGLGGRETISITLLALLTSVAAPTITAAVVLHSTGGYILTTSVGALATSVLGVRSYG